MAMCRSMLISVVFLALFSGSSADSDPSAISKVVTLIKEMTAQSVKDGEADTAAYDKYKCWCETTEQEKSDAIAAAQTKLQELSGFLEEAAAKEGELKTEIAGLEDDIAKDQDALESATSMRAKENKEFSADEADSKETLGLLAEAIGVLSKVQLMQKPTEASLVQVSNIVRRVSPKFPGIMQKDLFDMLGALENVEEEHVGAVFLPRNRAAALEQSWKQLAHREGSLPWLSKTEEQAGKEAKPNAQNGAAAGAKSYNARSGSILGLLKQMGDNTAKNLASAQKEELNSLIAFQQLQAAKSAEIASATKQKDQKTTELSDLLYKVAKAKDDVEETSETLAADEAFLAQTLKGCAVEDEAYASRSKVRGEEIKALGETLEILTGDEARSLFDKTINSFIQVRAVSSAHQEKAKNAAMQRILATAKKSKNWALASLAVRVRLDTFGKVKAAMDKMMAELNAQQKAEYEKGEACKKDLDATEDKITVATNTKEDLDQKHTGLTNTLEQLANDLTTLNKEVGDMQVSLKTAGEQRKANNQLFQQSMSDQRATITILNMAAARLKKFYAPGLVQIKLHAAPPPPKPAAFEKQNGGVMQLLADIISDAESEESVLRLTEQDEQKDYSEFVSATTASIEADRQAIEEKEEQKAQASGEKSETEESQLGNDASLAKLNELLSATHTDCDWILKYFDIRQNARKEEMNAIEEAKAILSGANFA